MLGRTGAGIMPALPRMDTPRRMTALEVPAAKFVVPPPIETAEITMSDGAPIRLRRYGAGPVRLMLSHGNGLAIAAYLPFWEPLADDFELVAFDIRNHGENPPHDPRAHTWPRITRDIAETFDATQAHFGEKPTAGVFHSLSAVATLLNAVEGGPPWAALALFDPPIFPPPNQAVHAVQMAEKEQLTLRASARPVAYRTPEAFAAQLKQRRAFARFVDGEHLLFAQSTLRPLPTGEWGLRCPRDLEAFIFDTNDDPTLWGKLTRLKMPVILIGADPDLEDAGAPSQISRAVHQDTGIDYVIIRDTTHFLQVERPDACRDALTAFLQRCNLAPAH
jgi:pimeloyl-ACP methyl ester carboxylesterase